VTPRAADEDPVTWPDGAPGLLVLPSGLRVRGRGVRRPMPDGPEPTFAVHLLGDPPPPVPWESRWVHWADMWLPSSMADLRGALAEIRERAPTERVEVACAGGRGRTGTSLACLAVLEGVPRAEAVGYVRRHYDRHAVETPWQRWLVRWLPLP
jgi:protein-tyrosine phosphatase